MKIGLYGQHKNHQTLQAIAGLCFSQIEANSCGLSGAKSIAAGSKKPVMTKPTFPLLFFLERDLSCLFGANMEAEREKEQEELTITKTI
tara:strand:+ start:3074 stop:3340 length:267 start_codon:yes stop_codon:yes gene_type:complete